MKHDRKEVLTKWMKCGRTVAAVVAAQAILLLAMAGVPSPASACNPYTFTMASPLNPLQAGVQRLVGVVVKGRTGLSIVVAESKDVSEHLELYTRGKSDLLVVTGTEPKEFIERAAGLEGKRIEGKVGIILIVHPDTVKLFPKMVELMARVMADLERTGREGIAAVTDDVRARRVVDGWR